MNRSHDIEARAADFLARRDRGDWDATDQAVLDAWLGEGAEHRVAWLRLDTAWSRADRLGALRSPAVPLRRRKAAPAWRWPAIAAGLVLAVAAGFGGIQHFEAQSPHTYATSVGGTEVAPLSDGSRVQLNTDTQVRARVGGRTREVWLDRGEAWFEVAHDPEHPFKVYVGDRTVTVLGTKFSVRRDGQDVRVVVAEGRVRVDDPAPGATAPTTIVTPGDVLLAKPTSTLVAEKSLDEVNNALSWRRGVLVFNQSTLGEAAVEFNRYNQRKLVVDDEAAEIRIGGSFQAQNIDDFARLLQQGFGLKVERTTDQIVVSR